jgi:hypothetical protein
MNSQPDGSSFDNSFSPNHHDTHSIHHEMQVNSSMPSADLGFSSHSDWQYSSSPNNDLGGQYSQNSSDWNELHLKYHQDQTGWEHSRWGWDIQQNNHEWETHDQTRMHNLNHANFGYSEQGNVELNHSKLAQCDEVEHNNPVETPHQANFFDLSHSFGEPYGEQSSFRSGMSLDPKHLTQDDIQKMTADQLRELDVSQIPDQRVQANLKAAQYNLWRLEKDVTSNRPGEEKSLEQNTYNAGFEQKYSTVDQSSDTSST